jgi:putative flippase GtrA
VNRAELNSASRFAVIGGLGFLVDGGLLALLVYVFGGDPLWSRVWSFSAAVIATWSLNRRWTFRPRRDEPLAIEFARYLGSQGVGCAVNLVIYALALRLLPYPLSLPMVALAGAAGVALVANYVLLRAFVFLPRNGPAL